MTDRSRSRLVVIQVLVVSLLVTLAGRLWAIQVHASTDYEKSLIRSHVREITTPAVRGQILDDQGRTFVGNRTSLVVAVSRTAMVRQKDDGKALIARLAKVLGRTPADVWARTRLCGTPGAPSSPTCWNGSPYEPIPVAEDTPAPVALQILERQELYPGVTAELRAVREYPGAGVGANAAHLLGYVGPVSAADLTRDPTLQRNDIVGRAGLEREYDADLRGKPGVTLLDVDNRGSVLSTVSSTDGTPGNHLVTSLDARVQAVAEEQLRAAIVRARTVGDINKHGKQYKADSGAVVVMDVHTGRVIAMASYPTYDPKVWVGGITTKEYAAISGASSNYATISRATQGQFAPGSTFKVVSLPAAIAAGNSLSGTYQCTSSFQVGGRTFKNYESEAFGTIDLKRAIEVSCDTIFYKFAYDAWVRDGGITPNAHARNIFTTMAKAYGLGKRTGIDLPEEAGGRIADRAWKQKFWERTKDYFCTKARTGFPEVAGKDPARAVFLKRLASENCTEGNRYRAGDAVNFAIGQGDTTLTPLQLVRVYAAIANGGTLYVPSIGKAILSPSGQVIRTIKPKVAGHLPVSPKVLNFLRNALASVPVHGTARYPFRPWPLDAIPMAAKTGTAEVFGKQSTSWFATYGPANRPDYAVVMMVSQGGTGSGISGPSVEKIYEALLGVKDRKVVPGVAILRHPPVALPTIRRDGTVVVPPLPAGVLPPSTSPAKRARRRTRAVR